MPFHSLNSEFVKNFYFIFFCLLALSVFAIRDSWTKLEASLLWVFDARRDEEDGEMPEKGVIRDMFIDLLKLRYTANNSSLWSSICSRTSHSCVISTADMGWKWSAREIRAIKLMKNRYSKIGAFEQASSVGRHHQWTMSIHSLQFRFNIFYLLIYVRQSRVAGKYENVISYSRMC